MRTNCTLLYFHLKLSTRLLFTFFSALQIIQKSVNLLVIPGKIHLLFLDLVFLSKCGYSAFCTFCSQVLQHVMDGLISFTFKPEDMQCLFFRYMARELLAGAVMRPVLNLASPRHALLPFLPYIGIKY